MKQNRNEEQIEQLRKELQVIRRASLMATRKGDFMKIAKLNTQAQNLNRAILQAEGLASLDLA